MPEIIFNGPAGRLEARYTHSKYLNAPIALVLHPHPQHGGTMNNKVTYEMHQALVARGFSTMRFNFRGVGKSQGVFDRGEGELSDAATALDWLQEINKNAPYVWIAGFQFGAWIGMQLLMRRPEIRGFVSVAPPANIYDFSFLAPCPSSGLILQGGRDDVVPEAAVKKNLVDKLMAQKGIKIDYRVVDGANHFFHEKTDQLIAHLHDHMDQAGGGRKLMPEKKEAAPKKLTDKAKASVKPKAEKAKLPAKTKSKKVA
jgi:alpha/beta superfamily hydrolase